MTTRRVVAGKGTSVDGKGKRRGRPPGTHPPKKLTDRVDFYVTPEMKRYILSLGGGAFLRGLVRQDAEAQLAVLIEGQGVTPEEVAALERILSA